MAQQRRLEQQLKAGIRAAQKGNKDKARELLEGVVKQSPNNEVAWIWLASVMTTTAARRACLERVLKINPKNERARQALNRLVGIGGEGANALDTEKLVAAAAQPPPQRERREPRPNVQQPRRQGRGVSRRQLQLILGGVAVFLVIALILSLLPQINTLLEQPPTATPSPTATSADLESAAAATNTPTDVPTVDPSGPTPTFSGVLVERTPFPTDTPTDTPTPTVTATPTATLPPAIDYTVLFVGESLTGDDTALYRALGPNDPERLIGDVTRFAYDPASGQIAVVQAVDAGTDGDGNPVGSGAALSITSLNNPDQQRTLVNVTNATISSVTFSPNGEQLVYASDVDGDFELYLYDLNGDTTIQLTDNNTEDNFPSWSPDGSQLVFTTDQDTLLQRKLNLYAFGTNLTDGEVSELSGSSGDHTMPQWSPEGSEIVYTSSTSLGTGVLLTDSTGTISRDLTFVTPADDMAPAWSQDGLYIFYVSQDDTENFQIYSILPDGGTPTRITNNTLNITQVQVLAN